MRTGRKKKHKKRTKKLNKTTKKAVLKQQNKVASKATKTSLSTNPLQLLGLPLTKLILWFLKLIQTISAHYNQTKDRITQTGHITNKQIKKASNQLKSRIRKKRLKLASKSHVTTQYNQFIKKLSQRLVVTKDIVKTTVKKYLKLPNTNKPKTTKATSKSTKSLQASKNKSVDNTKEQVTRWLLKANQLKDTLGRAIVKELYSQLQLSKRDISRAIQLFAKLKPLAIWLILWLFRLTANSLSWVHTRWIIFIWQVKQVSIWFNQLSFVKLVRRVLHASETKLNRPIYLKLRYVLATFVILGFIGVGGGVYNYVLKDLPDVSQLGSLQPSLTTKIYDRNGILLYKIYKNENRSLVPLEEIPDHFIQATIAIEDQNFYQHPGFSIRGITRALRSNLKDDDTLQGGSTITQQLIKNTILTPERTWQRKAKELVLSFITEFYFSKDQILEMYLNQVAYGGSAYGVEEAAQMYFGKSIREVDLAEATFLAGLPQAPSKYSPYGPHPELAKVRQQQVMRRMVEDGYIPSSDAQAALEEELAILPPKASLLAPHFVMYIRDVLTDLYGPRLVEQGGLEVTTSLDLALQNKAQELVTNEVASLQNLHVTNGASVITNPQTGEVLAMVGSVNYFDSARDGQVNVTLRERQPGSSIKPITYSMALERGLTPASLIEDAPICYNIQGQPPYCPKNYDGNYHGRVTIRQALANSYNVPAVKTLAQFSVDDLIDHAEDMGISTWGDRNRFGLSLTLGGGEVKMIDMAVAYGVFANQGVKVPLRPILEVKTTEGEVLATNPCVTPGHCRKGQVLDPRVAYQITDILKDNDARSRAFGRNSVLYIPNQEVAVKTGTTNSMRDNWTIGYTNDFLVATWVGNNDNTPMAYVASGITGASPIWNKITTTMLAQADEPAVFEPPANLAKVQICNITGQLACNGCPSREEYFIPGTEPTSHCSTDAIANLQNPRSPDNQ